jgi:hypothetical protein
MKNKTIIFVFVLFLCSQNAIAQRIAIQGGLNTATVTTNDAGGKFGSRLGYNAMIYVETMSKNWSVNVGLGYSLRGFSTNNPAYVSFYDESKERYYCNLHNMILPLTVSYRVNIVKNKLALVPAAGFYGSMIFFPHETDDPKEKTKLGGDFGLRGELGLEIFRHIQIGADYDFGLLNISKQEDIKWKNSVFEFYVRFFF